MGIIAPPLIALQWRLSELPTAPCSGPRRALSTSHMCISHGYHYFQQCETFTGVFFLVLCSCQKNQINLRKFITFKSWLQTCPTPQQDPHPLNSSVNTWDEQVFGEILRCFYMVFWFPASLCRSRFLSGIIFFSPKVFHKNFISSLVLKDIFTGNGALSWKFFSSL